MGTEGTVDTRAVKTLAGPQHPRVYEARVGRGEVLRRRYLTPPPTTSRLELQPATSSTRGVKVEVPSSSTVMSQDLSQVIPSGYEICVGAFSSSGSVLQTSLPPRRDSQERV